MKITIVSSQIDFFTDQLIKYFNFYNLEVYIVNFSFISEVKEYNNWGNIIIWKCSSIDMKNQSNILYKYLKYLNKTVINLSLYDKLTKSELSFQQDKVNDYYWKTDNDLLLFNNKLEYNKLKINKNIKSYKVICLWGIVFYLIEKISNDLWVVAYQILNDKILQKKLSELSLEISSIFNLNLSEIDYLYDIKTNKFIFWSIKSIISYELLSNIITDIFYIKMIDNYIELSKRNKNNTIELVYNYYNSNYMYLWFKKFHYSSRIFLWFNDKTQFNYILSLKTNFIGKNKNETENIIKNILLEKNDNNINFNKNEYKLRNSLKEKYPMISKYNSVLFKFIFTKVIYKKNISNILLKNLNIYDLLKYRDNLYESPQDLAILSTIWINFIYSLNYFLSVIKQTDLIIFDPKILLELGLTSYKNKEVKNKYNLQVYYYTHCIINESLFYSRKIVKNKKVYLDMIKECELIISNNYFDINLDNKLEFLVCTKIIWYNSILSKIIYAECNKSLSSSGNYLVDTINSNHFKKNKNSFADSEHRNVLFLMYFLDLGNRYMLKW